MLDLIKNPIFYIGLAIKITLILVISPLAITEWYSPFLENSMIYGSIDPWSSWQDISGSMYAFPYGYAMWFTLLPISFLCFLLELPYEIGYELTILICDFALLCVLNSLIINRQKLILFSYWLSPVIILASYGLGFNDVIPALFLMISILFLYRSKLVVSGIFFAIAISAKLSMIVVLPFLILYLFKNKPLRHLILNFLLGLSITIVILGIPFILSTSAMEMLVGNPEMSKILSLSVTLTKDISVLILPIVFSIILYYIWRVRRLNFDLFMAINGVIFLIIIVLMPSSSGWFIWAIPFLIFYQATSGRTAVIIVGVFSILFVLEILYSEIFYLYSNITLNIGSYLNDIGSMNNLVDIINTGIFIIGIILIVRLSRESISGNDFFRKTRQPFVIGIAGDSGAGKDTFSDSISNLFGMHSVATLSGDDYHLWDRNKPMWQVMTHLNPMANNLEGFCGDLIALTDGKHIQARHYNHSTGKMSKLHQIKSNDFIIASGLHALYLPQLRDCYNLKVYLDIDENLRRFFKIKRDVNERGHKLSDVLASLDRREADSKKFIHSQKAHSDLIFSLQPIWSRTLDDLSIEVSDQLKLIVKTTNSSSDLILNRALVGLCGLHLDTSLSNDGSKVNTTIEGEVSGDDIAMAAKMVCPEIFEFMDINPKWNGGVTGIMQLVTLCYINQALVKRFAK